MDKNIFHHKRNTRNRKHQHQTRHEFQPNQQIASTSVTECIDNDDVFHELLFGNEAEKNTSETEINLKESVHFPIICPSELEQKDFELPTEEYGALQIEKSNSDDKLSGSKYDPNRVQLAELECDNTVSDVEKSDLKGVLSYCDKMAKSGEKSNASEVLKFEQCVQLSALEIDFSPVAATVGNVSVKGMLCQLVIILCSNHQTVVITNNPHSGWKKVRTIDHKDQKKNLQVENCCLISNRGVVAFVLITVDDKESSAKIYACSLQGRSKHLSRILCFGELWTSEQKHMLCYPDCDREVIISHKLKSQTILTKFVLGHNYTTVLASLDFDAVNGSINSLVSVDGIRSLVLATSRNSLLIWSSDSGALIRNIQMEQLSPIKRCHFAQHEKGMIYLIVEEGSGGGHLLLAVNPHTDTTVSLQTYHSKSSGNCWDNQVISQYIIHRSDDCVELWDVFNAERIARLDLSQLCSIATSSANTNSLVLINDNLCFHVYRLVKI